jgi:hypothetical protein
MKNEKEKKDYLHLNWHRRFFSQMFVCSAKSKLKLVKSRQVRQVPEVRK